MNKPVRTALIAAALTATLLVQTFAPLTVSATNDKATYYGGTIPEFKDAKHPVDVHLQTSDETSLKFTYQKDQVVSIPYANFIDMEYGLKSGRRVGAAVASTILLGPIGLLFLMSKKQKHYLTIGFKDAADKEQVAVFQVDKDSVRTLLPILEARSGKKIIYEDKNAEKKAGKKETEKPAEKTP